MLPAGWSKDTQTENERMKNGTPCKWKKKQKQTGIAIFIPNKIDLKTETVTRENKGNDINIKE